MIKKRYIIYIVLDIILFILLAYATMNLFSNSTKYIVLALLTIATGNALQLSLNNIRLSLDNKIHEMSIDKLYREQHKIMEKHIGILSQEEIDDLLNAVLESFALMLL